ncbi:MAG TPA: DUF11 domain-containing protein [Longimicrobiaceae bacterium]|nr:DUF11 domain-containing protein [Longimicrobiaceae bacterium]
MRRLSNWSMATALGIAVALGACDTSQTPVAPSPDRLSPPRASFDASSTGTGLSDDLYLIDNICPTSNPDGTCAEFGNGSVLYSVSLAGGSAVLTRVFDLSGFCASNDSSIDCSKEFDQAHLGATPDGQQLWVVQRRPNTGGGNPAGYYDVSTHQFVYKGEITGIGPDGVVLAAFAPTGDLFVANISTDALYRVNTSTLAAEQSWQFRVGGVSGPVLDLAGADIAFDAKGQLYVYTNRASSTQERGLYSVTFSGGTAIATFIADFGDFFTGLAFRAQGNGDLVMSNAFTDDVREVDQTNGSSVASFAMTGDLTDHKFGDMTTGKLTLPAPGIGLVKLTNGTDNNSPTGPLVDVGSTVTWTYNVTNTGNVPLSNIVVTDDQGVTPVYQSGDVNGNTLLDLTETWTYTASGTAVAGQYENTGTATGSWNGTTVTATDPDHYFGKTAPPPPPGTEGCTPGYWKQSQHFGDWKGYTPDEQFSAVFENAFPGMTLEQVLSQGGGGLNALGRHTVAALLNAASGIDYGLTTTQVIQKFNAVFPGGDYEGLKDEFAARNERDCPLNGGHNDQCDSKDGYSSHGGYGFKGSYGKDSGGFGDWGDKGSKYDDSCGSDDHQGSTCDSKDGSGSKDSGGYGWYGSKGSVSFKTTFGPRSNYSSDHDKDSCGSDDHHGDNDHGGQCDYKAGNDAHGGYGFKGSYGFTGSPSFNGSWSSKGSKDDDSKGSCDSEDSHDNGNGSYGHGSGYGSNGHGGSKGW